MVISTLLIFTNMLVDFTGYDLPVLLGTLGVASGFRMHI